MAMQKGDTCRFTERPCPGDQCIAWQSLDDFEGCGVDLAEKAVKEFGMKTLKPVAKQADQLLGVLRNLGILKGGN